MVNLSLLSKTTITNYVYSNMSKQGRQNSGRGGRGGKGSCRNSSCHKNKSHVTNLREERTTMYYSCPNKTQKEISILVPEWRWGQETIHCPAQRHIGQGIIPFPCWRFLYPTQMLPTHGWSISSTKRNQHFSLHPPSNAKNTIQRHGHNMINCNIRHIS